MAKRHVSAFSLSQKGQVEDNQVPSPVLNGLEKLDTGAMRRALMTEQQIEIGPFHLRATGLRVSREVTENEWHELGRILRRLDTSLQWLIGDWRVYGEREWSKTYQEVAEQFDYRVETLWSYASVCRAVDSLIRNQGLSFSHHRLVAALPPEEQSQWLDFAAENGLSLSQMRVAMAGDPPPLPLSHSYDWLFSRENKPNINAIQRLFIKARQGDTRSPAPVARSGRLEDTSARARCC